MVRGTTKKGFEFSYEEDKLNDMRFVDALAELEEDPLKISTVLKLMLSTEERERLYKAYETEDGRVPIEGITEAITEMMEAKPEVKNS